jgi:lactam utilization protein B
MTERRQLKRAVRMAKSHGVAVGAQINKKTGKACGCKSCKCR